MSFFTEAEHGFLPVPEDKRIETKSFLDAASEVVPFFGKHHPSKVKFANEHIRMNSSCIENLNYV